METSSWPKVPIAADADRTESVRSEAWGAGISRGFSADVAGPSPPTEVPVVLPRAVSWVNSPHEAVLNHAALALAQPHLGESQPALFLTTSPPGFHSLISMGGAVLEISRLSTAANVKEPYSKVSPLRGTFTMRGQLLHAFVSYRVDTEGSAGNGLADGVASKLRSMSTDSQSGMQIPKNGWGIWPKSAKRPVPFLPEEAKVFLDKDCLFDGQSRQAGFVQGLTASMCVVPILSWTEDDQGSVGELSRIGVDGFDRVDQSLLELILASALREEPGAAVQAILPVIVGPAWEGGGFGMFPYYKLARLSDEPSTATNALAAVILRQLGLGEGKVQAMLRLSVKQVVDSVMRNQGVQASAFGDVEGVVTECATRVLKTVLKEMQRLRSDPKYFEQGRPMGSEVLEWLQEENLRSYAPLFVHHRLDSLDYVARLEKTMLSQLSDEHEELFPKNGLKGAMGGELAKLVKAHNSLLCNTPRCLGLVDPGPDERTLPLAARLEGYRDTEASAMAVLTSGNSMELFHTMWFLRCIWIAMMTGIAVLFISGFQDYGEWGPRATSHALAIVGGVLGALLPLICRTARMFADALAPWAFCFGVTCLVFFCSGGVWEGALLTAGPVLLAVVMAMRYRQKYVVVVFVVGYPLTIPVKSVVECSSETYRAGWTYEDCVAWAFNYNSDHVTMAAAGSLALFLVARKFANDFWTRRAARESRDLHRALWREELSKVAATPEVMDGLKRLAGGIARELREQRRRAVRSLGVVARVKAFLDQRAGRWSLRGYRSKLRQVHGDINLLFDEAAMVNEPFLDMIASLVAGIGSTDGLGEEQTFLGPEDSSADSDEFPSLVKTGIELRRGPIKKPARALQKLVRLYGRDVAMLTDLVRCTVLAEDLRQVEALMATLDAISVVGPGVARRREEEEGDEGEPLLDMSDDETTLRITAMKNRFDESYDDNKSGGYRDVSLNVEVGWTMEEGLVTFQKVRDWGRLECQRHICEIQVRLRSQHHQIVSKGLHTRYVELRNQQNT